MSADRKVHYERVPIKRYQEGGDVDPYDPLAASAGHSVPLTIWNVSFTCTELLRKRAVKVV